MPSWKTKTRPKNEKKNRDESKHFRQNHVEAIVFDKTFFSCDGTFPSFFTDLSEQQTRSSIYSQTVSLLFNHICKSRSSCPVHASP